MINRIKTFVLFGVVIAASAFLFQNCGRFNPSSNSATEQAAIATGANSQNSNGPGSPSPAAVGSDSNQTASGGNGKESIVVNLTSSSKSVPAGSQLILTASAVDSAGQTLVYSWTINGQPIGTNSSTLTIDNIPISDNGASIAVTVTSQTPRVSAQASLVLSVTSPVYQVCNPDQLLWGQCQWQPGIVGYQTCLPDGSGWSSTCSHIGICGCSPMNGNICGGDVKPVIFCSQ